MNFADGSHPRSTAVCPPPTSTKSNYGGKHGVSDEEMAGFIQARIEAQQRHGADNRRKLVELTQKHKIYLASHDDATPEHVQEAIQAGATIAEFPTTLDAAKEAHRHGLQVLMGSPNLILGKSHSGNVSAMELVEKDLVDIISSDYVPQSFTAGHVPGCPTAAEAPLPGDAALYLQSGQGYWFGLRSRQP